MKTVDEIKDTAEYFGCDEMDAVDSRSSSKRNAWPKMVSRGGIWIPREGGENRTDRHAHYRELRKIRSAPKFCRRSAVRLHRLRAGWPAVKKGEALLARFCACVCHGADLQGARPGCPASPAASPSYLARQLYDMQAAALERGRMGPS
jgi:hypothetical protein